MLFLSRGLLGNLTAILITPEHLPGLASSIAWCEGSANARKFDRRRGEPFPTRVLLISERGVCVCAWRVPENPFAGCAGQPLDSSIIYQRHETTQASAELEGSHHIHAPTNQPDRRI